MTATVLIVDDEESIRKALQGILEDEGYHVALAPDGVDALESVQKDLPDLVLLDIWMPRLDGMETLQRLKELQPDLPVVMISGHGTIETAVKSTKLGAFDFIEKPLSLEKVLVTVQNAIRMSRLKFENASLRRMIEENYEIIGDSPHAVKLREQVRIIAPSAAAVLILGENGTGKELLARVLHRHSPRGSKPFVGINCAAIPAELIESELFGHEKGAIPGANSQKKGKFDLAEGGLIFLDEISELPLHVQEKLSRVLEEHKFERAGGTRSIDADIRIIAASSRSLEEAVRAGRFREDLYYLLNVVPFATPPLKERQEDIPALAEHFLAHYCRREGRELKTVQPAVLKLLQRYDWPGNIRELKNIMERLAIISPGSTIEIGHLPETILHGFSPGEKDASETLTGTESHSLREAREEFERDFILQKLDENDWNITRTAEAIELERTNLHRKIKNYGIEMRQGGGR